MSPSQQLKRPPSERAPTRRIGACTSLLRVLLPVALVFGLLACEGSESNPPPQLSATIAPSGPRVFTVDDLVGGVQLLHPREGSDARNVIYTWSWTVDGVDSGVTTQTVPSASTIKNQLWEVTVSADDGVGPLIGPATAQKTVLNTAPVIDPFGVIFPGSPGNPPRGCNEAEAVAEPVPPGKCLRPQLGVTLTSLLPPYTSAYVNDDDGDPISFTYEWSIQGTVIATTKDLDMTAYPSIQVGDRIRFEATPRDNEADGLTKAKTFTVDGRPYPKPTASSTDASIADASTKTAALDSFPGIGAADPSSAVIVTEQSPVSVRISEYNVCSIGPEGGLECTGADDSQLAAVPAGGFAQIEIELDYACAIRADDQSIHCWGAPLEDLGQLEPPEGAFSQIEITADAGCGLRASGEIVCWGEDALSQATLPVGEFVDLDVSGSSGCAVDVDGVVACWGTTE